MSYFYGCGRIVGKTLKSVSKGKESDDSPRDTVTFHCEEGDYVYVAEGDCCSHSFIESISGPTVGKIIEYSDDMFKETDHGGDNVIKNYKTKLTIEGKGYLDIEYRNESNGYYGGWLEYLSGPEEKE